MSVDLNIHGLGLSDAASPAVALPHLFDNTRGPMLKRAPLPHRSNSLPGGPLPEITGSPIMPDKNKKETSPLPIHNKSIVLQNSSVPSIRSDGSPFRALPSISGHTAPGVKEAHNLDSVQISTSPSTTNPGAGWYPYMGKQSPSNTKKSEQLSFSLSPKKNLTEELRAIFNPPVSPSKSLLAPTAGSENIEVIDGASARSSNSDGTAPATERGLPPTKMVQIQDPKERQRILNADGRSDMNTEAVYNTKFDILKEISDIINAPSPFEKEPHKVKVLVAGQEPLSFVILLKTLNFTVHSAMTAKECIMNLSHELTCVILFLRLADTTAWEIIPKLKQLVFHVPFVVLYNNTIKPEERKLCLDAGAFDCFPLSTPVDVLGTHIKGLYEANHMRKQIRHLLVKEKEDMILTYDSDIHLYNKTRLDILENNLQILEEYKREAQSCILMLEEENVKLRNQLLEKEEEYRKANHDHIAGKWKMVAMKATTPKKNTRAKKFGLNKEVTNDEDLAFASPIQKITRTVGRLTKVSDLLDAADLKNVLTGIVDNLQATDLYAPSSNLIEQLNVDDMTKKYLLSSFTDAASAEVEPRPTTRGPLALNRQSSSIILQQLEKRINLDSLMTVEFDVFAFKTDQVRDCLTAMFGHLGLLEEFDISLDTFHNFIGVIKNHYYDNPYHNFTHAFDVCQMCFVFITKSFASQYLNQQDKFSMLVAALCHDLCHPGTNNTYQVNAGTELALTYNDQSVLENHHCSKAFYIMRDPKYNLLENLSPIEKKEVRKSIISAILATDMAGHFELTAKFTTHVEAKQAEGMFNIKEPKERQLLLNVLLHGSDISNMVRTPEVSRKWADLVFDEFLLQGDRERQERLPISPFMDRYDTDQAKMSLNFMEYVVSPLFNTITKALPEMAPLMDNLRENKTKWMEEANSGLRKNQSHSSSTQE